MKKIYPYLTYAGAIPFLFLAFCLALNLNFLPFDLKNALAVYGLVIAAFMAGSHWGQHLHLDGKWNFYLAILSNINAVFLWISFVVLPFKFFIIALIISFVASFIIDKKLQQNNLLDSQYLRTRFVVTTLVILALIIAAIYG